jgi:excisionase family DNA binding protein
VKQLQNVEGRIPNAEGEGAPASPEITITAPLRLLTRTELADALRVSPRTVDRMQAEGEITPVMLRGFLVRFYLPDVVRQLMARALVSKRGCARKLDAGEAVRRSESEPRRGAK